MRQNSCALQQIQASQYSLGFLFLYPFVRAGFKKIEGKRSTVKHLIMEGLKIKPGAQLFPGTFAAGGTLDIVAKDVELACALARDVGAPVGP